MRQERVVPSAIGAKVRRMLVVPTYIFGSVALLLLHPTPLV